MNNVFTRTYMWVCISCGSWLRRIGRDDYTCPWCGGCLEKIDIGELE